MDLKDLTKSEIGGLLGLPAEESGNLVAYLETIKNKNEFCSYLIALLGDDAANRVNLIADRWFPSTITATSNPRQTSNTKVIRLVADSKKSSKKTQKQQQTKKRICYCMGITHGLFTNCLNCGKILCKEEEDKCCTFCDVPIGGHGKGGSKKKQQQQQEKQKRNMSSSYKAKLNPHIVSVDSPGVLETADPVDVQEITNSFPALGLSNTAEMTTSKDTHSSSKNVSDLTKAQERRDRLLQYDKEDVARTRIIDAAEDFESTQTNMWLSPADRALAKKKQLEYEKQVEEEKKKVLVSIDLQNQTLMAEDRRDVERPDFSDLGMTQKPVTRDFIPPTVYYEEGEIKYVSRKTGKNQEFNQAIKIRSTKRMIVDYDDETSEQ